MIGIKESMSDKILEKYSPYCPDSLIGIGTSIRQVGWLICPADAALLQYRNIHELPDTPEYVQRTIQGLTDTNRNFNFLVDQYGLSSKQPDLCSLPTTQKGYIHQMLDNSPFQLWNYMPKVSTFACHLTKSQEIELIQELYRVPMKNFRTASYNTRKSM